MALSAWQIMASAIAWRNIMQIDLKADAEKALDQIKSNEYASQLFAVGV